MHALPHKVTVQTATASDDGQGGQSVSWANTVTNLPAHFDPRSGREFLQVGALQNALGHQVRVSYHASVTVKARLVREPSGPTCEVLEVVPVQRGDSIRYLDCAVIEVDG